ncbi:MAG: DUF6519 domain-containing protein [Gemmatimonadota bacterium]|jgi:phage tail sheath protein FI|nr:DUF6519 domain-containing protein [Gemmatimonadota bacterium]
MSSALNYPGVYIEEIPNGARTITGVATSITLFVGWAPRGPADKAVHISSFADYHRIFGGWDPRADLGYAVEQFFGNGGGDACIVRLVSGAALSGAIIGDLIISASSPGIWANDYSVSTTRLSSGDTQFRLRVTDKRTNAVVESFENLSVDSQDPRYIASVINGRSNFITVGVTPADKDKDPAVPSDTSADLAGGSDGMVLVPNTPDFHNALLAAFGPGSITDHIDLFNIVCVPGETDSGTLLALQQRCYERRAFLIADADENATVASLNEKGGADPAITGAFAVNSALYFPWVRAPDPLRQGAFRAYPPCGFVAGVFARTDARRGVWKAPAGSDAVLNGATGVAVSVSEAGNAWLNSVAINCLRTLPVYGHVIWGSRTLRGQADQRSEWMYISVRRTALYIEESLLRGTQWVVSEPNDESLWARIRLDVGNFMHSLFLQGAFQGQLPEAAYFVRCDQETTTQDDINHGVVNFMVGFAPLKPAEFVVIQFQQIAGDVSRTGFDAEKDFSDILQQQDLVPPDADINEGAAVLLHYMRTLARDMFGQGAGPADNCGFKLKVAEDDGVQSLHISKGRYYVNGILVEIDEDFRYEDQPYRSPGIDDALMTRLRNPGDNERDFLIYVDVWERQVTAIEDDSIHEVADGLDTSTRTRLVWQVRAIELDPDSENRQLAPSQWLDGVEHHYAPLGSLNADGEIESDLCTITPIASCGGRTADQSEQPENQAIGEQP